MDENPQPQDTPTETPAVTPPEPVSQDTQPVAETPEAQPESSQEPAQVVEAPAETPTEPAPQAEEEEERYQYQVPQSQPIDFNNLPVNEDNQVDPNMLAGSINQSISAAEERAFARAQQAMQEQRVEEKSWDRAYDKHPELKENKELRDLVHRARLGEVTDLLSRTQDPSSVKLPTPSQVADKFFKNLATAKAAGMKQANENTVVQASAHVETAGRRTNDGSDSRSKLFQQLKNPNKEVSKKAGQELLKDMLFSDK